jgi:chromosome segregation ATPase
MKKILKFFLLACGLSFAISGCGMDELKKEVASKNNALNQCASEKSALDKKVTVLTAALSAKEGEIKQAQAAAVTANGNLAIAGTELSAARVQAGALTAELDTVKADLATAQGQLKDCSSKKPRKK